MSFLPRDALHATQPTEPATQPTEPATPVEKIKRIFSTDKYKNMSRNDLLNTLNTNYITDTGCVETLNFLMEKAFKLNQDLSLPETSPMQTDFYTTCKEIGAHPVSLDLKRGAHRIDQIMDSTVPLCKIPGPQWQARFFHSLAYKLRTRASQVRANALMTLKNYYRSNETRLVDLHFTYCKSHTNPRNISDRSQLPIQAMDTMTGKAPYRYVAILTEEEDVPGYLETYAKAALAQEIQEANLYVVLLRLWDYGQAGQISCFSTFVRAATSFTGLLSYADWLNQESCLTDMALRELGDEHLMSLLRASYLTLKIAQENTYTYATTNPRLHCREMIKGLDDPITGFKGSNFLREMGTFAIVHVSQSAAMLFARHGEFIEYHNRAEERYKKQQQHMPQAWESVKNTGGEFVPKEQLSYTLRNTLHQNQPNQPRGPFDFTFEALPERTTRPENVPNFLPPDGYVFYPRRYPHLAFPAFVHATIADQHSLIFFTNRKTADFLLKEYDYPSTNSLAPTPPSYKYLNDLSLPTNKEMFQIAAKKCIGVIRSDDYVATSISRYEKLHAKYVSIYSVLGLDDQHKNAKYHPTNMVLKVPITSLRAESPLDIILARIGRLAGVAGVAGVAG